MVDDTDDIGAINDEEVVQSLLFGIMSVTPRPPRMTVTELSSDGDTPSGTSRAGPHDTGGDISGPLNIGE
jgi:hypothetical protein